MVSCNILAMILGTYSTIQLELSSSVINAAGQTSF